MGKILDTLTKRGGNRRPGADPPTDPPPAAPPEAEEVPFIEVGGRRAVLDASPAVLAAGAANRPGAAAAELHPQLPRLATPPVAAAASGLTVHFRPVTAELRPPDARFAPELVAFHRPAEALGRQYQGLAASLLAGLPAGGCRLLLFTAARPDAGATTVLLNLAITFARQGKFRVGVVDANRPQPALAEFLGLPEVPGLGEALAGGVALNQVLQETGQPNLLALTAGSAAPGVCLDGAALHSLLGQLRERFDLVLIDAPCLPGHPGLIALAASCDAAYLVSPEREADAPETARLLYALARQGVPLRGHLLTGR